MAREILEPASRKESRAKTGGIKEARDVMGYRPPHGPTSINDPKGPGLHGQNYGHMQKKTAAGTSGCPGLGGKNRSSGSQR